MKKMKKSSYKDISIICENLYSLYNDGLQITKSIELLNDFPLRKDYKDSIKDVGEKVRMGKSLGESFSKFNNLYPSFLTGMISIGEKTGRLNDVLKEMSIYYKRKDAMKNSIINASIYPIFLIISMLIMCIFFIIFIIPQFESVYSSLGTNIPKLTKNILNLSIWINKYPFVAISFILFWFILTPIIFFKLYYNKLKNILVNKIKILKEIREYEVILLIKVIVVSGTNISVALKYCEEDNLRKKLYSDINEGILKGNEISEVLEDVINPSNYTIAMIKLGEESGSLDDRLENLTNTLNERCNDKFKKIASMFQPISIVLIACIVFIFLMTFILPIFDGIYGGIS